MSGEELLNADLAVSVDTRSITRPILDEPPRLSNTIRAKVSTAGEQMPAMDCSPAPSGLPLVLQTTHHGRTSSTSSVVASNGDACSVTGSRPDSSCSSDSTNDHGPDGPNGALLPIFPSLPATDVDYRFSESSQQDIAKEAMRLSKQTLSRGEGDNDHRVNPRLSMALPMKLSQCGSSPRLNKFVRRLHDMLSKEKDSGIVEWRRGLLVLKSTGYFAKHILPKYFNTRNFKTFRRQLNYYGFVHIRSFSNAEQSTCALWVNGELAKSAVASGVDPNDVSSVLLLRRVEISDQATTNEMRRLRKELAISTIEKDLGISAKALQLQTLTSIGKSCGTTPEGMVIEHDMMNDPPNLGHSTRGDGSNLGEKLEVDSIMYLPTKPSRQTTIGFAEPPSVVSATDESMIDADDGLPVKAPPSNASAANLLLLLSKA